MNHGRYTTYVNHKCRCIPCKQAWREYCRRRRAQRAALVAAGRLKVPHGTEGGYSNYKCRCIPCKRAHADTKRRANAQQ